MIDRISFFLEEKVQYLSDRFLGIRFKLGNADIGYLGQIQIQKHHGGLYISCSLPKLIYGENITVMPRKTVKEAVWKLEDMLNVDLSCVSLTSMEIGVSIIVAEHPSRYMRLFGNHPRYPRAPYTDSKGHMSVRYAKVKGNFSFQAYDKKAEMKDKKVKEDGMPSIFQGSNVLRLEAKIKRRKGIQRLFGMDLSPHDLYKPDVYEELKRYFWKFYSDISKTDQAVFFDMGEGSLTPKRFEELLAKQYCQSNPEDCLAFIAECKAKGSVSRDSYSRIKGTLRPVVPSTGKKGSFNHKLIEELYAKVWDWVKTG